MMRSIVVAIAVGAAQLAVPARVNAQVLKKIRAQVEQKLEASKARADSTAVARAGQIMDSTLAKTGEIVSSAAGALGGSDDEAKLAAELRTGRIVLTDLHFVAATDQLADASEPHLERLAKVLKEQSATFLIEGHVDDGGNAAAEQALSEKRAAAVKARLVAAGVPGERVFAMGLGATRPPTDPNASHARIEVARMK